MAGLPPLSSLPPSKFSFGNFPYASDGPSSPQLAKPVNTDQYGLPGNETPANYVQQDHPPTLVQLHQYITNPPTPNGSPNIGNGSGNGSPGGQNNGGGVIGDGGNSNPSRNPNWGPGVTGSPYDGGSGVTQGNYRSPQPFHTYTTLSQPASDLSINPKGQYIAQVTQPMQNPVSDQTAQNAQPAQNAGTAMPNFTSLASGFPSAPNSMTFNSNSKTSPGKPAKPPGWSDAEYQQELRNLQNALSDYKSKMGINTTRAGTQYAESKRDLTQQKTRDLSDIENDFAARGIINSGVYGQKLGDYNQLSGQQFDKLSENYKNALTDIQTQFKDYQRQYQQQLDQAKLAAIRRRAQKLNHL